MLAKFEIDGIDSSCLKGKSALIVSGGSAAALKSGLALAKAGARVTIAANTSHVDTVEAFRSQGLAVQYVKCDVTSWSQQLMAFKQAIQFAPSRSLDIVCSFLAGDGPHDMEENVSTTDTRIDVDPMEPVVDGLDMNVKAVSHLTKLAVHFFKLPDRATALKRARSRSGSSSTSFTASSVHSRPNSRPASRPQSRSGSRTGSPVPTAPGPETSEGLVITEEPDQKNDEKKDDKPEDKEVDFTKSLILSCAFSAYTGEHYNSSEAASSCAIRGLFRSLHAACKEDLNVRVNLVSGWPTRERSAEAILQRLADDGLIERETAHESTEAKAEEATTETETKEGEASTESDKPTTPVPNGVTTDSETKEDSAEPTTAEPTSKTDTEGSTEAPSNQTEAANGETSSTLDQHTDENKPTTADETTTSTAENESEGSKAETNSDGETAANQVKESAATTTSSSDGVAARTTTDPEPPVKYKNVFFASPDDIASTVVRLCSDSTLYGRAIAVMPDGAYDLKDDYEGGYAGEQVKTLLNQRKQAGDMFCKLLKMVPEEKI